MLKKLSITILIVPNQTHEYVTNVVIWCNIQSKTEKFTTKNVKFQNHIKITNISHRGTKLRGSLPVHIILQQFYPLFFLFKM